MDKTIIFNDKEYKLSLFRYFSGREGVLATEVNNESNTFNVTLNIDSIPDGIGEIIVKDYDFNKGLLEVLIDNKIIKKQTISRAHGYNQVYICKVLI